MFFRKKKTPKLVDIVPKVTHTDYVYNNIMGDLGHACDDINRSTPLMVMAYAYARRTAAAAMYIQGLYDRDTFAYVQSMFVKLSKTHRRFRRIPRSRGSGVRRFHANLLDAD